MKHHFLDQYSEGHSLIHHLDPRAKFTVTLVLVAAIVLTPRANWLAYGLFLMVIATLLFLSRVPLSYMLKRSLVVLPFVLLVGIFIPFFRDGAVAVGFDLGSWHIDITHEGLELLGGILAKAWLSVLCLILLAATTRMSDLLKGLEKLRMPSIMVMLGSFMYRYLFVLSDEVMKLRLARDSRSAGGSLPLNIKTAGHMAGTLFLRSYERGERIYGAMLSRGFDGHSRILNELRFSYIDLAFVISLVVLVAFISLISMLWV